jgi:hypothetical protein
MLWIILSLLLAPTAPAEVKVPTEVKQKFQEVTAAVSEGYHDARARSDETVVGRWVARKLHNVWSLVRQQGLRGVSYLDRQLHSHVEIPVPRASREE